MKPIELAVSIQPMIPTRTYGRIAHTAMADNVRSIGIVHAVDARELTEIISAEAPLKAMFGCSTSLRSATQGRGTHAMEFSHFALDESRRWVPRNDSGIRSV